MRPGAADDTPIIVRTIVGLGRNLGLTVVAEGVEAPQQLAIMQKLQRGEMQGYLLGGPMPMDAPIDLMVARARMVVNGQPQDIGACFNAAPDGRTRLLIFGRSVPGSGHFRDADR